MPMPRSRGPGRRNRAPTGMSTEPSLAEEHPGHQSSRPKVGPRALVAPCHVRRFGRDASCVRGARRRRLARAGPSEMAIAIETPLGTDALTEFVLFQVAVYAARSACWTALTPLRLRTRRGAR